MKNLRVLLLLSFLSLVFFTNCSDDSASSTEVKINSVSLTSKLNDADLQKLKDQFKTIMRTSEYIAFNDAAKLFASNLNGNDAPVENRDEFVGWISSNLVKTKFSSAEKAIQDFDNVNSLGEDYVDANTNFWNSLIGAEIGEIAQIFGPEMGDISFVTTGSCQTTCQNTASDQIDMLEYNYNSQMTNASNTGQSYLFPRIRAKYFVRMGQIGYQYANCMDNCAATQS
jgi:hypothetical protein